MPAITEIFSVAEARAFDKGQLFDSGSYSDAVITAAEAAIRGEFARVIGVALIPTETVETLDGDGTDTLYLANHNPYSETNPRPVSVSATTIAESDGTTHETFDADDLTDLASYPSGEIVRRERGTFLAGRRNVEVTYTHGFDAVQADIKRAALQALTQRLIPTSVPFTGEGGYATEGGVDWSRMKDVKRERWYGVNEIDGVLNQYRMREMLPGIA